MHVWHRGQLASDEVQLLLWQILHVLKYLHVNNVWHRDLKSANVLVKLENGQRIIKVCPCHGLLQASCFRCLNFQASRVLMSSSLSQTHSNRHLKDVSQP